MEITAAERRTGPRGAMRGAALIGASAFVAAGALYALATLSISVPAEPDLAGMAPDQATRAYFGDWFVATLGQERLSVGLSCLAFACLAAVAVCLGARLADDRSRVATTFVTIGASLWIVASVLQLGGHRAVGLLATHDNPIQPTNSIAFTIDVVNDAFQLAASVSIAVGLLVLTRSVAGRMARSWIPAAAGILMLALAVAYATGPDAAVEGLLVVGGVVALPALLVWAGLQPDRNAQKV